MVKSNRPSWEPASSASQLPHAASETEAFWPYRNRAVIMRQTLRSNSGDQMHLTRKVPPRDAPAVCLGFFESTLLDLIDR
jgi:hypothetical protein